MAPLIREMEVEIIERQELTVITKAKDLCTNILTVTEKSPKRFRFTLTSRIQNLSLELIEQIYRPNEIYLSGPDREAAYARRLDLQHGALTSVKLLGYMALLAREQGAVLPRQYEQITKSVSDCQNLLGAWINSDRKRRMKGLQKGYAEGRLLWENIKCSMAAANGHLIHGHTYRLRAKLNNRTVFTRNAANEREEQWT